MVVLMLKAVITDTNNDGEVDGTGYNTNGIGSDGYGIPTGRNSSVLDNLDANDDTACRCWWRWY